VLLAVFWLGMNLLLWRTEFGSQPDAASAVPVQLVWRRILNSPDSSSLTILRDGTRIGYCHWVSNVGEAWASIADESLPEGVPAPLRSASLRLEGSIIVPEWTNRIRFEGLFKLETNRVWRELDLRITARPLIVQLHASAPRQVLSLTLDNGALRRQQSWNFSELSNPAVLLSHLASAGAPDGLADLGAFSELPQLSAMPPVRLHWKAWEDTLPIGHVRTRVYRLETTLLEHYRLTVLISRVGEILRVELPGRISLVNDQLSFQ
jgi:hypothetical protein